ncbi:protein FAR1-RELATED SEQUENCE 6-like [Typha angustifolia]|uniref:protein FAR1-RELATED SEQUENCE 6-like n=1 Tax=Typha angustifolia TaxID=59011 RepID=UPI003C2BAEC7
MAEEAQSDIEAPPKKDVDVMSLEDANVGKVTDELETEADLSGDHKTIVVDEGVPRAGMVFKTFEEVYDFYNQYARRIGFGTKIRRSWYSLEDGECNKVTFTCCKEGKRVYKNSERCSSYRLRLSARTDCQAKIKVQKRYADGLFHLTEVVLEHNHPVNPAMSKYFRSHKDVFDGMKRQTVIRVKGQRDVASSVHENENSTGMRSSFLGNEDSESLQQFLIRMQSRNTNFFHLMDLDAEGRVKSVFWADGRCKSEYQYFNDVIALDTTYLTGNYETPLASFVGVNHHGHLVLLGCGLLWNRKAATYRWLFKTFLSCMSESPPNAIITDHCKAMQEAVADVFPGAHHRLCLWHIMKRIQEFLGGHTEYKAIKGMMKRAVYDSLHVDEFEDTWKNMIEKYELEENDWLKSLYEDRHKWVPVFVKDTFWAGLSTTQHKESMSSYFEGYIFPKTSVKQFLCKYETALQCKYEKEIQADLDSFHKSPPQLISKFYMEDQLRKIYTVDIFKKFQEEVKAILYCIPLLVSVDGPTSLLEVKEPIQLKDGNVMDNKKYEVRYNSNDLEVQCICCAFQIRGILCRHALSVLNFLEVYEIPAHYILERWQKDYKQIHIFPPLIDKVSNGPLERYGTIYKNCLKFAEVGAVSDDNYVVALKVLNEAMGELIASDCTTNGIQLKTYTMSNKRNLGDEDEDIHDQVQETHKGQHLKKRKESLAEKIVKTSKRKISQRKSAVSTQNDMLRTAPSTPQFDPHIWAQESINLMEPGNPTNLSIGSHFGMPLNQHHVLENQPGIRWNFQQMFQQAPEGPAGPWAG